MMARRVASVVGGGLLAIGLFGVVSPSAQEVPPGPASVDSGLVGRELAASLGLEPVTQFPVVGCQYFAEVEDAVGYCLDPVVTSERDAWLLSIRITGRVPTAGDEEMYDLLQQRSRLAATGEDETRLAAIIVRLIELMGQKEQTT